MLDDFYFLKESVVDVNAAIVGISKSRWIAIEENLATQEQAIEIMRAEHFDVLPITSGSAVKEYFQTEKWNDYSSISRKSITHRDVIPLHTNVRELIKGFASKSRLFYFLSNENRIAGLVSIANLNSRQVKIYLFSLLSELEIRLGTFIAEKVSEDELLAMTFGDDDTERYEEIKARYKEDKKNGVEVAFVEYLYLSDLINITVEKDLYLTLGYGKSQFKKDFGSLNELRKAVAHPNRSIITKANSVERLWQRIDRIEEALFRLR